MTWPAGPAWPDEAARRDALSGRVAVVTGASRGLGAGLAAHFAAAGLHLGLCARRRPNLVAMTRPRAHDGRVDPPEPPLVASVDVSDPADLAGFAESVIERFGRIDLWVNNAGVLEPVGPLVAADLDAVDRHFAVNLSGTAFGTMLFSEHVRRREGDGVLVNVTSGAATHPYAGWAAYCAAKAGVDQLTEVVALEEAPQGLRAHAVAPGMVDTEMQALVRSIPEEDMPEVGRFLEAKVTGAFNSTHWVAEKLLELAFGEVVATEVRLRVPDEPRNGS